MATLELSNEELYDLHVALCGVDNESYTTIKNKVRKAMGYPIDFKYDQSYENVAKLMMEAIQYDNGMCNRWEREKYPEKWVELIRQSVETFFKANPQYLNEEDIERIGMGGEESEDEDEFGKLEGWEELNRVLGHYFDHYPEEDEPQGNWVFELSSGYILQFKLLIQNHDSSGWKNRSSEYPIQGFVLLLSSCSRN